MVLQLLYLLLLLLVLCMCNVHLLIYRDDGQCVSYDWEAKYHKRQWNAVAAYSPSARGGENSQVESKDRGWIESEGNLQYLGYRSLISG